MTPPPDQHEHDGRAYWYNRGECTEAAGLWLICAPVAYTRICLSDFINHSNQ